MSVRPQPEVQLERTTVSEALAAVRAVAEEEAARTDASAEFPVEALSAMRRTGLLGLMVPEAFGGAGGSLTDLVDTTLALGRSDMSVAMIFAMHCQQVATLDRFGTAALRERVLPAVARGEVYIASVTTEPGKGGHLLTSESPATRDADGWIHIDRQAPVVTGGAHADGFLVTVLTPGATSPAQVDLVYADQAQLELEVLGGWSPLGMRATHSIPMRLAGEVPEDQLLGERGEFRTIVASTFGPLAHLGWSAAWLGTAAGALSRVVEHVRSPSGRKSFDPSSDLLLAKVAAIRVKLDVIHALLRHTLAVVDGPSAPSATPVQLLVNTLKTQAAEECFAAVHQLVELVGLRHGYLTGSPMWLERAFRDLRSATLNYGNERLLLANGALALLDREVNLA